MESYSQRERNIHFHTNSIHYYIMAIFHRRWTPLKIYHIHAGRLYFIQLDNTKLMSNINYAHTYTQTKICCIL